MAKCCNWNLVEGSVVGGPDSGEPCYKLGISLLVFPSQKLEILTMPNKFSLTALTQIGKTSPFLSSV